MRCGDPTAAPLGDKYSATHLFRMNLANDDWPRTMHAEAERTERDLVGRARASWTSWGNHRSACSIRLAIRAMVAGRCQAKYRDGQQCNIDAFIATLISAIPTSPDMA